MGQSFSSTNTEQSSVPSSKSALYNSKTGDEGITYLMGHDTPMNSSHGNVQSMEKKKYSGTASCHHDKDSLSHEIPTSCSSSSSLRYEEERLARNGDSTKPRVETSSTKSSVDSMGGIPNMALVETIEKSTMMNITSLSDILVLSNSEIKTRLKNSEFSIQSIRNANNIVVKYNLCHGEEDDIFSWYHDHTTIQPKTGTVTVVPCKRNTNNNYNNNTGKGEPLNDSSKYLQERNHMELALLMLKLSPQLKAVRFKMVPAKISESSFWNAVFYLLLTPTEQQKIRDDCTTMAASNTCDNDELKMILVRRNHEIDLLQQQLRKFQQVIVHLQQQQQQQQQHKAMASNDTNQSHHNGKWIMDKESHEFLALDEEIKLKLRDGKRKRLQEVQEQMKFILDSDNVEDSNGRWDCCGNTSYKSKCSC